MANVDYDQLGERLGKELLEKRLHRQANPEPRLFGTGGKTVKMETLRALHSGLKRMMKIAGLYKIGRRNALDVQTEKHDWFFPNLPKAFDGTRILHLSDIHIDQNPALSDVLGKKIAELEFDYCFFTGDFREGTFDDFQTPTRSAAELLKKINTPVYAVLGNHDFIEMVPILENAGIRVLLNEHVLLKKEGAEIALIGVDDPYHFKTDDLAKAASGIPENSFNILLAHAPNLAIKIPDYPISLYLCGHTHGGQVCYPGGRPILARSRRNRNKGRWQIGEMQGYTSRGAGVSSIGVRFHCPPEITLHVLHIQTP